MTSEGPIAQSLRRQRDFRLAWVAGLVNDTGDWVLTVALPVFVFVETRSGAATAILFVSQLGPAALLGPIAGAVVDRIDLRRCLILIDRLALRPLPSVQAGIYLTAGSLAIVHLRRSARDRASTEDAGVLSDGRRPAAPMSR